MYALSVRSPEEKGKHQHVLCSSRNSSDQHYSWLAYIVSCVFRSVLCIFSVQSRCFQSKTVMTFWVLTEAATVINVQRDRWNWPVYKKSSDLNTVCKRDWLGSSTHSTCHKTRRKHWLIQVLYKLNLFINSESRVISGTRKYERGPRQLRHSELHWLDVADRVTFKLCMTVHKCLHAQAPDYLSELCTQVARVAERQHLRSASRRRAKDTARHIRPSGVCCGRFDRLERTRWFFQRLLSQ